MTFAICWRSDLFDVVSGIVDFDYNLIFIINKCGDGEIRANPRAFWDLTFNCPTSVSQRENQAEWLHRSTTGLW